MRCFLGTGFEHISHTKKWQAGFIIFAAGKQKIVKNEMKPSSISPVSVGTISYEIAYFIKRNYCAQLEGFA